MISWLYRFYEIVASTLCTIVDYWDLHVQCGPLQTTIMTLDVTNEPISYMFSIRTYAILVGSPVRARCPCIGVL